MKAYIVQFENQPSPSSNITITRSFYMAKDLSDLFEQTNFQYGKMKIVAEELIKDNKQKNK